ncbi:hypothetical protein WEI85_31920 [Actinomycetes bacterium KLBMP 9797]
MTPAVSPSMAVVLFAVADLLAHGGAPDPRSVTVSERFGLEVETWTLVELRAWAARLGIDVQARYSQPYTYDGISHTLTNTYGTWRGTAVRLHCCEPVDGAGHQ